MIFKKINSPEIFHLYYFIDNKSNEEKQCGLSHVSEHVCIMPYFEKELDNKHFANGYTCLNHACLYYCSNNNEWLQYIYEEIRDNKIVTEKRVEYAKHQVISECQNLKHITALREKMVRFVTENRIKQFAMGDIETIKKIHYEDVLNWINEIKDRENIYCFRFSDSEEIRKEIMKYQVEYEKNYACPINSRKQNEYLIIHDNYWKIAKIELYIQLPVVFDKASHIGRIFWEYCLKIICSTLINRKVEISEKYYTNIERFLVVTLFTNDEDDIEKILDLISDDDFIRKTYKSSYINFTNYMDAALQTTKRTYDYINEFQNYVLYGKPLFNIKDKKYLDTAYKEAIKFNVIAAQPKKIIIFK